MHFWPIVLPPLFFLALFVTLLGAEGADPADGEAWRRAFVKTALVCGALVTASTEILSLFRAVTGVGLTLCWILALLAALVGCWRTQALARALRWTQARSWRLPTSESALLVGLAAILLLTALVAWVSPPNTTDSHLYHMSRVVHWAQNASLRHYPTAYEHQLWFPPWAETAILTLRLLWGNDQAAGLIQWLSYAGCLVVAAGIAGLLGAGRRGRLLGTAFCASIPMALLQATSTQNDLTVALWLLCLVYLVTLNVGRPFQLIDQVLIGVSLGLGILTKQTSYLYALPFVVWHLVRVGRSAGVGAVTRAAGAVGSTAAAVNIGFWSRNLATYGSPIGSLALVQGHTALGASSALTVSWAAHLLTHFATPSEPLNRWMEDEFVTLIGVFRRSITDFHLTWSWNHEDLAGSPLHLLAIGLVLLLLVVLRKRRRDSMMAPYAAVGVVSFGLLTTVVSWNPYVVRLHLPFLVLMSPLVGAAVESWLRPARIAMLSAAFLLAGLPWLLLNQTRPVFGLRPRTAIVSVFQAEQVDILFANWLPARDSFIAATDAVEASGCTQIGLRIDSHDLEYPYWWLLGAPQNGMRLEHLDPYPHLARYVDPAFRPCAILCTVCGDRLRLHGLERVGEFGEIAVFAGDAYQMTE